MSTSIVLLTPIVFGAAIAIMDMATGRGFGLTLLVVVALGVSVWALWSVQIAEQHEAVDAAREGASFRLGWGVAINTAAFLIVMCYAQIVAGLAGLAVAALSGQWRWVIGIVVGLVALVVVDLQVWQLGARVTLGPLLLVLLAGAALSPCLAYGIWRIAHTNKDA